MWRSIRHRSVRLRSAGKVQPHEHSSGSGAGFTYTVTNSELTWQATIGGERLVFNATGYYDYTPPAAALPVTPTAAPSPPPSPLLPMQPRMASCWVA